MPPMPSPWVQTFGDYLYSGVDSATPDHAVQITINFDNTTRVISNAVVWRAKNCRWTKIVVGLGGDGTVETSARVFDLSTLNDRSRTIPASQFNNAPWNVTTIEQFSASGQITATP